MLEGYFGRVASKFGGEAAFVSKLLDGTIGEIPMQVTRGNPRSLPIAAGYRLSAPQRKGAVECRLMVICDIPSCSGWCEEIEALGLDASEIYVTHYVKSVISASPHKPVFDLWVSDFRPIVNEEIRRVSPSHILALGSAVVRGIFGECMHKAGESRLLSYISSSGKSMLAKVTSISQCGFYSTVFILDYFEKPFNPVFVSEKLPVTDIGISLNTINKLLQAYGLTTTGRKNVKITDLKYIPSDTIALVAIPNKGDTAHYYVVAPTKKGTVLIDVPFGVALVNDIPSHEINMLEERLVSQGGVVLFVKSPAKKQTSTTADTISISPAEHNLGEFLISQEQSPYQTTIVPN
jgi:hypothetical protein